MKIGVLAVQGDVAEHLKKLTDLGVNAVSVRLPHHLDGLDALVIPGGESTTIGKLLADFNLVQPIKTMADNGLPIFATCAGMILLATHVDGLPLEPLALVNMKVRRNAFGRQLDSFEADLAVPVLGDRPFHAIFIRAPLVENVEPDVEILSAIDSRVVAVKQGNILACAFHPELTDDLRFHHYFLDIAKGANSAKSNNR